MNLFAMSARLLLVFASAFVMPAHADVIQDAKSLLSEGRHDAALERIEGHISSNPKDSAARFLKGVALAEAGRRDEGIAVFTALITEFPELPEPHNNLAVLYAAKGDLDQARAYLLEAIRLHPSYATAHENLGDVYGKLAALSYSKALTLDSANHTAREKHALAEKLIGKDTGPRLAAAAAPRPAPSPAATSAAAPAAVSTALEQEVLETVSRWSRAWSSQDLDSYLSHYAAAFVPADGRSRDNWTILRRKRVLGPRFIEVDITRPEVTRIDDDRARVTFHQSYRSDSYADQVIKTLDLVRQGERWKILSERTVE